MNATNLEDKKVEIGGRPWTPVEVALVNDHVVRMALARGQYHWHRHDEGDELFFVHEGFVTIHFGEQPDVRLGPGSVAVVPKGVEHCPESTGDSYIVMFEPVTLVGTGSQ